MRPLFRAPLAPAPLRVADRCDRCGARAACRAIRDLVSVLLFCGHHGREHAPALAAQGFAVEWPPAPDQT